MVSRLRKPAEVRDALARFADGQVDILIGTHRLLSRDVRAKDLGLVIVDEEQRFGVKQKELLRQLKLKVDVLSLSATPIPRTLQMSLAGLRDISVIETPPEGRRPVRTYVGPYDEELVARAIKREAAREGQVFFLHNRIDTLHEVAERLRARLSRGCASPRPTGRWTRASSRRRCSRFLRGDADCLVATTIIESGLDIPQANTLIVERADQLGLAQAYQIRGRVGRSRERAFAYMLYPSEEALSPEAGQRLATLSDHTELGSGFAIAMRDLELRGAGDLLGDEQSGHVAAVGFELYVALLDEAVEALRAAGEERAPSEAAGAARHRRRRLPAGRVHPVRGGEDRRPPPDRRRPRGGRAARAPRRAARPLRPGARAGRRTCSRCSGRGSSSRPPARAPPRSAAGGSRSPRSSSMRRPSGRLRERIAEAIYELRTRTLSLRVGDDPGERLASRARADRGARPPRWRRSRSRPELSLD